MRSRLIAAGASAAVVAGMLGAAAALASGTADRAPARVAPPPSRVIATHRADALRAARAMLAEVALPAGSTVSAPRLDGRGQALASPMAAIFLADQVDVHRFWTTGAAPGAVLASIAAQLPARAAQGQADSGSGERSAVFVLPRAASPAIALRQLSVTAIRSGARTIVRVDAEVQYRAARSPSQDVPSSARVLDVRRVGARYPGSEPLRIRTLLARTITDPAVIHRIAALIDALPLSGNLRGVEFSCPAQLVGAPVDTFTFHARAGGPPVAVVTMAASAPRTIDPCATGTLRLGRRTLGLEEGGTLLRRAGRILHARLTVGAPPA